MDMPIYEGHTATYAYDSIGQTNQGPVYDSGYTPTYQYDTSIDWKKWKFDDGADTPTIIERPKESDDGKRDA